VVWSRAKQGLVQAGTVTQPPISIIIPTYNRPLQLARCLSAVGRLDFPPDGFETIVVDDGGDAVIDGVVAPLQAAIQISLYRQRHGGPASARNSGAARARGSHLVFLDDDCLPAPDWLSAVRHRLYDDPGCLVGGPLVNALTDDVFATASDLLIGHVFRSWNGDPDRARFLVSANLAVSADCFASIGGFDQTFPYPGAEDRDLCARWLAAGRRIVLAPECIVRHAHDGGFRSFWRQHVNYGRGAARFHRRHPHDPVNDGRPEPLSFYLRLFGSPYTEGHGARAPLLSGLLFLAQVAELAGFAHERRRLA
jgi:GT2 family glycosyltransferase